MEKIKIIAFVFAVCSLCAPVRAAARPCPRCGDSVLEEDRFCPYCGHALVAAPQPAPAPVYAPQPAVVPPRYRDYRPYGRSYRGGRGNVYAKAAGDRLAGMGRGVVTAALSPLNLFRGAAHGVKWAEKSHATDGYSALGLVFVGMLTGTFATCADAIDGSLDLGTFGYFGDWLYDSKSSGRPTPWVWERDWAARKFPWIDRK